jgi:DNA-binding transcriptional MerR regulator
MSQVTVDRDFWSKAEAARALEIDVRALGGLIRRGLLAPARSYPGVRRVYRRADVLALKERFEPEGVGVTQ